MPHRRFQQIPQIPELSGVEKEHQLQLPFCAQGFIDNLGHYRRTIAVECRAIQEIDVASVRRRACIRAAVKRDIFISLALAIFRSEEHTSELQSLMRISYAVFCLKKKTCTIINKIE